MAFTAQLGNADAQLGNLLLGSEGGGSGPTTVAFTCRARILVPTDFTSRARILQATSLVPFTSRAHIMRTVVPEFTARARILHAAAVLPFTSRARIQAAISTSLQVSFRITPAISFVLPVQFNITGATRKYVLFQSRARIQTHVQARVAVDFTIEYTVPSTCVLRPTQRQHLRTVARMHSRARIISSVPPP